MSFQAYLDTIEKKSGLAPRQLIAIAHEKGLDAPGTKASEILATSPQIPTSGTTTQLPEFDLVVTARFSVSYYDYFSD